MSHSSPTVKDAVIAAASVLENLESYDQDPSTRIALRDRHRITVRSIVNSAENAEPEDVLVACLLFTSCELASGAMDAAILHLQAGLKMLKERMAYIAQNHLRTPSILSEHIIPVFAAYSTRFSLKGVKLAHVSGVVADRYMLAGECDQLDIPTGFVTIGQAYNHLKSVTHQMFYAHMKAFLRSSGWIERLQAQLSQWTTAMNALECRQNLSLSPKIKHAVICLLRNHHRLAQVLLSVLCRGDEGGSALFGPFSMDFMWILAQYDAMNFHQALANDMFTWVELIPPLFIIAIKSSVPRVRDEALRLLAAMARVEANWDSRTAWDIAQEFIAREDSTTSKLGSELQLGISPDKTRDNMPVYSARPNSLQPCLHNASAQWVSNECPQCSDWTDQVCI